MKKITKKKWGIIKREENRDKRDQRKKTDLSEVIGHRTQNGKKEIG